MNNIKAYIEQHKDRFLDELLHLLRVPSISADPEYKQDVLKASEIIKSRLIEAGVDYAEICETPGYPIVYAEKIIDKSLPTVLVYGHYDVQPADPLELWTSGPFEPVIKKTPLHPEGAIFARGACDDKGQMYMHVKAFELMMNTETLPCNVKFMIEGEEEVGSESLEGFLKSNRKKLACDVILISDTGILANDIPSITTGLRGLSYVEVEVTGPNRDLHSGLYGGAVANPINILSKMIASLQDENNRVTIPGFYDDVETLSMEERAEMAKAPFNLEDYKKALELSDVHGEEGYSTMERNSLRPTLDVNGIWGGYTGEGAKTVIASKAFAKISMRLVANQSSKKVSNLFSEHLMKLCPESCTIKVIEHHGGEPCIVNTNTKGYKAAYKAFKEVWNKEPVPTYDGGSIPIVALFKKELGLDSILMGFGLDEDAIHSPNESYGLFNFYKGIETITSFYKNFSANEK